MVASIETSTPPPSPSPQKKTPLHLVIESTGDDVKLESLAKKKITAWKWVNKLQDFQIEPYFR